MIILGRFFRTTSTLGLQLNSARAGKGVEGDEGEVVVVVVIEVFVTALVVLLGAKLLWSSPSQSVSGNKVLPMRSVVRGVKATVVGGGIGETGRGEWGVEVSDDNLGRSIEFVTRRGE